MDQGSLDVVKYFKYKIAALLHDPVDKAWLLYKHIKHEEKAREYAYIILGKTIIGGMDLFSRDSRCIVGCADRLASAIDRWVISILTTYIGEQGEERYISGVFEYVVPYQLRNIIDPRFHIVVGEPVNIKGFINELSDLLNINGLNIRLLYHLLYTLYETVFYETNKGGGIVGSVADTRAPTHTVFDHVYATASILNIVYRPGTPCVCRDFDGYIVAIDLAGVQKFINASRKLRDLWVSSWLASAFTWAIVWPLIYALGPDIMVSPSPRNNPFYYSTLLNVLKQRIPREKLASIRKYFEKSIGRGNLDTPRFGVMPTQVKLLLPRFDIIREALKEALKDNVLPEKLAEKIKNLIDEGSSEQIDDTGFLSKLFIELYKGVWESIIDTVREELVKDCRSVNKQTMICTLKEILTVYNGWKIGELERILDMIKEDPPLPLRVAILRVRDILKDGNYEMYEVYDALINNIEAELRRISLLKYSYPPPLTANRLYKFVKDKSSLSRRGFEYCSVCGSMPAVLRMPSPEEWENLWRNKGFTYKVFEAVISPGERLCVYDLVKRLLSLEDVFNKAVEKILGRGAGKIEIGSFPSVSHIAIIDFYAMLEKEFSERNRETIGGLNKVIDEVVKIIFGEPTKYRPPKARRIFLRYLDKVVEHVRNRFKELGLDYDNSSTRILLEYVDPEAHLFEEKKEIARLFRKIVKDKPLGLRTYYSIVRADGDNMGKLLSGYTGEAIGLKPIEYLYNALADSNLRDVVKLVYEGKYGEAEQRLREIYSRYIGNAGKVAKNNIGRLKRLLNTFRDRIPLTPTYHAAISRALMTIALIDQYIVEEEKGFIVYSGGDDLLALTPVSTSLSTIWKTRRVFSIGSHSGEYGNIGFMDKELLGKAGLTGFIIPLIVGGGRSYSSTYIHYRYPLYVGLKISYGLVEEKEHIVLKKNREECRKDIASIAYVPRGHGIQYAILPFRLGCNVEEYIKTLGNLLFYADGSVNKEIGSSISNSIIYDLLREEDTLKAIINSYDKKLYQKYVKYIIKRNLASTASIDVEKMLTYSALTTGLDNLIIEEGRGEKRVPVSMMHLFKIYSSASRS